jgi:cytochrome c556
MKKKCLRKKSRIPFLVLGISAFLIVGLYGIYIAEASEEEEHEAFELEPIPKKSLDKLYPPQAKAPVLLLEMLKLAKFFTSIGYDAVQNDWANAQAGFDNFKAQLLKLSGMIPEWDDHFKMDLVEELGQAVAQKNVPAIMEVRNKKVAPEICADCHSEYRISVWYRYHWKDFGQVMVDDPVSQKKLSYHDFMAMVAGDFEGIGLDVEQKQPANARKTFKAFDARIGTLKKSCEECHDPKHGERRYFVSLDVMEMIDGLGAELSKPAPSDEKVEGFFMEIGTEMCYECHQVHWPAATVQRFWSAQKSGESH